MQNMRSYLLPWNNIVFFSQKDIMSISYKSSQNLWHLKDIYIFLTFKYVQCHIAFCLCAPLSPYKPNICIITHCFPSDYPYIPLCIKYTFIFLILVLNCKHLALIKGPYGYPHLMCPIPHKWWKVTHCVLTFIPERWKLEADEHLDRFCNVG